ncbi:hypothetical protein COA01_33290 [Bacillus cereus]|uniref:hypothetical protein n=1 Tax=Bacillus cereus TaxID=1396 RepID=UPI000BFEA00A|nr:hypothetical protein [Bacillus cereus]PGP12695.1 hypothetical protein COA01_33290 [Bacillus cereus]
MLLKRIMTIPSTLVFLLLVLLNIISSENIILSFLTIFLMMIFFMKKLSNLMGTRLRIRLHARISNETAILQKSKEFNSNEILSISDKYAKAYQDGKSKISFLMLFVSLIFSFTFPLAQVITNIYLKSVCITFFVVLFHIIDSNLTKYRLEEQEFTKDAA